MYCLYGSLSSCVYLHLLIILLVSFICLRGLSLPQWLRVFLISLSSVYFVSSGFFPSLRLFPHWLAFPSVLYIFLAVSFSYFITILGSLFSLFHLHTQLFCFSWDGLCPKWLILFASFPHISSVAPAVSLLEFISSVASPVSLRSISLMVFVSLTLISLEYISSVASLEFISSGFSWMFFVSGFVNYFLSGFFLFSFQSDLPLLRCQSCLLPTHSRVF